MTRTGIRRWSLAICAIIAVGGLIVLAGASGAASAVVTASCDVAEQYPEPNEAVIIDASASLDADSYQYDFDGDGNFDTDQLQTATIQTTYDTGTYQPTVTVYNDTNGTQDVASCPELTVANNTPPSASVAVQPRDPAVGERVMFDARDSTDDDGRIQSVRWDFGADGTVELTRNGSDPATRTVNRTYQSTGTNTLRVTVEDDDGATDATTVTVDVVPANEPPSPSFSYAPSPAVAGEPTEFDATAASDPDGDVVSYRWDFDGDGTTDRTTEQPTTSYTFPPAAATREFASVSLSVVDDDGATGTTTRDVRVVRAAPTAACSVADTIVSVGEPLTLDASGSTNADRYRFAPRGETFGEISSEPTRTVRYEESGSYTPAVRVIQSSTERTDRGACPTVSVQAETGTATVPPTGTPIPDPAGPTLTPVRTAVTPDAGNESATMDSGPAGGDGDDGSGSPFTGLVPVWALIGVTGLGGAGLGLLACRAAGRGRLPGMDRRSHRPNRGSGDRRKFRPRVRPDRDIDAVNAGVFEAPIGGGRVTVADVGFEPDVVLVTASGVLASDGAGGTSGEQPPTSPDAQWSYGVAFRDEDGDIDQEVVAGGAETSSVARGEGSVLSGYVLALPAGNGETVRGRIVGTTSDGFEFAVDAPAAAPLSGGTHRISYQAFDTTSASALPLARVFKLERLGDEYVPE